MDISKLVIPMASFPAGKMDGCLPLVNFEYVSRVIQFKFTFQQFFNPYSLRASSVPASLLNSGKTAEGKRTHSKGDTDNEEVGWCICHLLFRFPFRGEISLPLDANTRGYLPLSCSLIYRICRTGNRTRGLPSSALFLGHTHFYSFRLKPTVVCTVPFRGGGQLMVVILIWRDILLKLYRSCLPISLRKHIFLIST